MKEYLLSVAMYSTKYAELFNYNEDDVSNTLGYIFRVYQEDVKNYSNQELSLLVTILSKYKEEEYKEYIDVFSLKVINSIINKARSPKEMLKMIKKIDKEYSKDKKVNEKKYLKIIEEISSETSK